MTGAGLLLAAPALAQEAATDLFSYRAGVDVIEYRTDLRSTEWNRARST